MKDLTKPDRATGERTRIGAVAKHGLPSRGRSRRRRRPRRGSSTGAAAPRPRLVRRGTSRRLRYEACLEIDPTREAAKIALDGLRKWKADATRRHAVFCRELADELADGAATFSYDFCRTIALELAATATCRTSNTRVAGWLFRRSKKREGADGAAQFRRWHGAVEAPGKLVLYLRRADIPRTSRGDAAAGTRIFRGWDVAVRSRPGRASGTATTRMQRSRTS